MVSRTHGPWTLNRPGIESPPLKRMSFGHPGVQSSSRSGSNVRPAAMRRRTSLCDLRTSLSRSIPFTISPPVTSIRTAINAIAQYELGSLALGRNTTSTTTTRSNVKLATAIGPNIEYTACHEFLPFVGPWALLVTSAPFQSCGTAPIKDLHIRTCLGELVSRQDLGPARASRHPPSRE